MGLEDDYVAVSDRGREWLVDPVAPAVLYEALDAEQPRERGRAQFGAHGPAVVISTGCTSGIDAIGYGHQLIQDGEADIVIAGASESRISPISMACFDPIRATSRRNDDPAQASRPFDRDRDGFVMGEGGAILVLEEFDSALDARRARLLRGRRLREPRQRVPHDRAEPGGARDDRGDLRRDGARAAPSRRHRLHQRARLRHQAERPARDRRLKQTLGDHAYKVPISSIKSMIGHSLGGIGAIEMAACALAIDRNVVPPTANWEHRDPECDLDYTPKEASHTHVSTPRCRPPAASAASSRRWSSRCPTS